MGSDAGFGIGGQGFFDSSDAIVNLCILEPRTFCPLDQVSRTVAVTQSKILRKLRQRRRGVSPTQVGRYIPTARAAPKDSVVARIDFVLLRRRRDDRLDAARRLANVSTNVLGCLVMIGGLRMGSDAGFGIGGQGFLNSSDAIVNLCILEPRTFCPLDQVSRTIAVTQSKILRKLRQRRRGVSPTQVGRYIATARRVLRA